MNTLNTIIEEEKKAFVEKGADIEHERWSKWQAWVHSKLVEVDVMDGHLTHRKVGTRRFLPNELYERWERQINTPYSELSEAEKESDRKQVRSYDALLTSAMQRAYEAGREERDTYWKERVRDVKFDIEALRGSPRDTDIEYARAITDVHKILDDIIDNLK